MRNLGIGLIVAIAVSLVCAFLLYRLLKAIWPLAYNAIAGILIFALLNYFNIIHIRIDVWTVLIAAIGGVFGVFIVLLLTILGIPL